MGILDGKNVLIIGASGGIGRACVEECLSEGAVVCGSYRNNGDKLSSFEETYKDNFTSFKLDLSDKSSISAAVKKAVRSIGGLDVLINAAGISKPQLLFSTNPNDFEDILSNNLISTFYTMQSVIVPMISRKGGSIVNISSVFGIKGGVGQSGYCASKAGIIGLTRTAALELAEKNIRVNAVAPGYIETEMTAGFDNEYRKECISQIPMKRFGTAKEVAEICVFLASNKSAYITGQTFVIDGGMTA